MLTWNVRRKKLMITGLLLLGFLLTTGTTACNLFVRLPDLLTIQENPEKADAIIVLAGDSNGSSGTRIRAVDPLLDNLCRNCIFCVECGTELQHQEPQVPVHGCPCCQRGIRYPGPAAWD